MPNRSAYSRSYSEVAWYLEEKKEGFRFAVARKSEFKH